MFLFLNESGPNWWGTPCCVWVLCAHAPQSISAAYGHWCSSSLRVLLLMQFEFWAVWSFQFSISLLSCWSHSSWSFGAVPFPQCVFLPPSFTRDLNACTPHRLHTILTCWATAGDQVHFCDKLTMLEIIFLDFLVLFQDEEPKTT